MFSNKSLSYCLLRTTIRRVNPCIVCLPHVCLPAPRLDVRGRLFSSMFLSRAPRRDVCEPSPEISVIYWVSPLHFGGHKYLHCRLCPGLYHVQSYPYTDYGILTILHYPARVQDYYQGRHSKLRQSRTLTEIGG